MSRLVVVGRNSKIWRRLSQMPDTQPAVAIGHQEAKDFPFAPDDTVWILSYARDDRANAALFDAIGGAPVGQVIYLSTATANVAKLTQCYAYPRTKARAEALARDQLAAQICRIGLVFDDPGELPAGRVAATPYDDLASAMSASAGGELPPFELFALVERPFRSWPEWVAHKAYGAMMRLFGRVPCVLRPVDFALRAMGWRWYGYLFLSNKLLIAKGSTS